MKNPHAEWRSRVQSRYEQHGQEHVLKHVDSLSSSEEEGAFLRQLDGLEVEGLAGYLEAARRQLQSSSGISDDDGNNNNNDDYAVVIEPLDLSQMGSTSDANLVTSCRTVGLRAVAEGQVCALVLAGGQGTRLGFDGPKGMFPLVLGNDGGSEKTLFELIAERLLTLQRSASSSSSEEAIVSIPWYVMTSPMNHARTVAYFQESHYFGLDPDQVVFFSQGVLPCLDSNGKMILESPHRVATAPDGNGGVYAALRPHLEDLRLRGVKYLHVFAVDNALVRPADPVFIGHCLRRQADCGNKVLWKRDASEKVGLLALKNGRPCVLEYSDLDESLLQQRSDTTGKLLYGAANICNHFYTLDFVQHVVLPNMSSMYHLAHKKIPTWDKKTNTTITPSVNNGIKLESFIFDVFPLSSRMAVLQVRREEEFAPVKNARGDDSPEQATQMLSDYFSQES